MKILPLLLVGLSPLSVAYATSAPNQVQVLNADFESEINCETPAENAAWQVQKYRPADNATIAWQKNGGVNDSACIRVEIPAASGKGSLGLNQKLAGLQPDTMYRLSAQVKTEDVQKGRGAVLFPQSRDQPWAATAFMHGTHDWTPVYVDFYSDAKGEATIACALGFWLGGTTNGGYANGVAYFDDVAVEQMTADTYLYESGKHITLMGDKGNATSAETIAYAKGLDAVYEGICEFVGGIAPYGGRRLVIMGTLGLENGYWALAGNPILINGNLGKIIKKGAAGTDLCFGVVHEMGHVFNGGGNFYGEGYTSRWNWDDELFANFRAYYGVKVADVCIQFHGVDYKGANLKGFYEKQYKNNLGASPRQGPNGDSFTYILIRLGDTFGWDVMRATFQDMYKNGKGPFANKWEKFNYILTTLEKHAKKDVRASFPEGELDFIQEQMSK